MNATTLARLTGTAAPIGTIPHGELRTLLSRRRVLAAARDLLRDEGYRSFSMEEVAALSGVTRRTVYNLFHGRDALYRASRTDLLEQFDDLLPRQVRESGVLRLDLEAFGRDALAALASAAHRELLASVRRDGATPWIGGFYRDHVDQPLCDALGGVLARHLGDGDGVDCASRARNGVALLRAAILEGDSIPALDAHEFAWIFAARLGSVDREALLAGGEPVAELGPAPAEAERRPMIRRGAVTITFDPVDVCWNGIRVSLSPLEAQLFALVVRRGRAPWEEIDRVVDVQRTRTNTREVLVFRLRRKFAELGAADPLETVRGWGLRFRTEPDTRGSCTLWIGVSEDPAAA